MENMSNILYLVRLHRNGTEINWSITVPANLENAKELMDKSRQLAIEQDQLLLKQYPPKSVLPVNNQIKQPQNSDNGYRRPSRW